MNGFLQKQFFRGTIIAFFGIAAGFSLACCGSDASGVDADGGCDGAVENGFDGDLFADAGDGGWMDGHMDSEVDADPVQDNEQPTVPQGVRAEGMSSSSIRILWLPSTDNVGVSGYKIFRDGVELDSTVGEEYLDTGLTEASTYVYEVAAFDAALNESERSYPVTGATFVDGRPADPGRAWVRKNPYTVSSLIHADISFDPNVYLAAGHNSSHPWANGHAGYPHGHNVLVQLSEAHGLRWHLNIWAPSLTQAVIDQINVVSDADSREAFYVFDEPEQHLFPGIADVVEYLKNERPKTLIYLSTADFTDDYVNALMSQIDPDVLMYCTYPFYSSGTEWNRYFRSVASARRQTLQYDVPFFAWIQAFSGTDGESWRAPSRSELRMNVFSMLAAGAKGLSYFLYDIDDLPMFNHALTLPGGATTALYDEIQIINPQVARLGDALRFLTSVDLRFIPGKNRDYVIELPNSVPDGLTAWSQSAGGFDEITQAEVAPGQLGRQKNGLIGFFEDDTKRGYFLLANLYCDESLDPAGAELDFVMSFSQSTDRIYRLNRQSGEEEEILLDAGVMELTLPGGTGDLFCFAPGCFDNP